MEKRSREFGEYREGAILAEKNGSVNRRERSKNHEAERSVKLWINTVGKAS